MIRHSFKSVDRGTRCEISSHPKRERSCVWNLLGLTQFVAVIVMLLAVASAGSAQADVETIQKSDGNKVAIVFVHGFGGSSKETWGKDAGSWPKLLTIDPDSAFSSADVFTYEYPSNAWNTFSISEIAQQFRTDLELSKIFHYDRIVFVAHSMGGLVTAKLLTSYDEVLKKMWFSYFFATPGSGVGLANLLTIVTSSPTITDMHRLAPDRFLGELRRSFGDKIGGSPGIYCAYETQELNIRKEFVAGWSVPVIDNIISYFAKQRIVDMDSASALCNREVVPIDADHVSIVKPTGPDHQAYKAFKRAFAKEHQIRLADAKGNPPSTDGNARKPGSQPIDLADGKGNPSSTDGNARKPSSQPIDVQGKNDIVVFNDLPRGLKVVKFNGKLRWLQFFDAGASAYVAYTISVKAASPSTFQFAKSFPRENLNPVDQNEASPRPAPKFVIEIPQDVTAFSFEITIDTCWVNSPKVAPELQNKTCFINGVVEVN